MCQTSVAVRLEKNFPCALEFLPERWLRDVHYAGQIPIEKFEKVKNKITDHSIITSPFGMGKRECVGKHLAQYELFISISKVSFLN